MRAELRALRSRTNLTEEDLQSLLRERDACVVEGNELGYAHSLLVLAHVVKWVRSDNAQPPFERCTTLAMEALPILRRNRDTEGVISALLLAVPGRGPAEAKDMLESALTLARSSGDDLQLARVLNRKAAHAAMFDREQALLLQRQALEIYERHHDVRGQASCLFSLAITEEAHPDKYDAALRASELFRSIDDYDQAAKSMSLVLMYLPKDLGLADQRAYAERGLRDAQASGKFSNEGLFYSHLARISAMEGNIEEAVKYRRWEQDVEESDGLTPEERRRSEIEFSKYLSRMAKNMGNKKAAEMFLTRLRELKSAKPMADSESKG